MRCDAPTAGRAAGLGRTTSLQVDCQPVVSPSAMTTRGPWKRFGGDSATGTGDDGRMTQPLRILTKTELAHEADVAIDEVDELVVAHILRPDADGCFDAVDVPRIRLAHALREGGITPDDLRWA